MGFQNSAAKTCGKGIIHVFVALKQCLKECNWLTPNRKLDRSIHLSVHGWTENWQSSERNYCWTA